jgi:hypothetical protein
MATRFEFPKVFFDRPPLFDASPRGIVAQLQRSSLYLNDEYASAGTAEQYAIRHALAKLRSDLSAVWGIQ